MAFEKKKKITANPYIFISNYTLDQLQSQLKKAIISVLSKPTKTATNLHSKENLQLQKKYIFGKCWDRIQADSRLIICEYPWLNQNRNGQFADVMDEMYRMIYAHYQDYLIDQQVKDIEKFQTDLNKGAQKKKRNKKGKKKPLSKQQKQQFEQEDFQAEPILQNKVEQKLQQSQKPEKPEKEQIHQKTESDLKPDQQLVELDKASKEGSEFRGEENVGKSETESTLRLRSTRETEQDSEASGTGRVQDESSQSAVSEGAKPKAKSLSRPGPSMKKLGGIDPDHRRLRLLDTLLASGLELYAKLLNQQSQKFAQTRKSAVEIVKQFLYQQDIKCKWQLVVYGSSQVGYSLKQSDLDVVLRIQDTKIYSLQDLQISLKKEPWVLEYQYRSMANVPIITMKVNLYEARKLSNRLLKKLDKLKADNQNYFQYAQDFVVTLDISMCGLKQEYGGVISSNNLRFLFYENQSLRDLILIIKDILRRKQLNKPYTGGINSYVLSMMSYGIIKKKQLQFGRIHKGQNEYVIKKKKEYSESLKTNLFVLLSELTNFLKDFVECQTVINPLPEEDIEIIPNLHLHIVDPFSKKLVKTSAFRISQIIDQLIQFRIFLDSLRDGLKGQQLENKKLKFQIFEKIEQYLNKLEPCTIIPERK